MINNCKGLQTLNGINDGGLTETDIDTLFISAERSDFAGRLRGDLIDCIQMLEALSATTEDEFLYIGSRLREVYERAVKISDRACIAAGLMSGDEMTAMIAGLGGLMESMETYLKKSESELRTSTEKLEAISGMIDGIDQGIEELDSLARNLRALGLSTVIQNAVLSVPDEGTRTLGKYVQNLSREISEKLKQMRSETSSLNELFRSSIARFTMLNAEQQSSADAILKDTLAGVRTLKEKYSSSASVAQGISEYSDGISQSLGNVVTALQFHDISRQEFEHSKAVFEDMLLRLDLGFGRDTGRPVSVKTGQEEILYDLSGLCGSQFGAILNTRDKFIASLRKALDSLDITSLTVENTMEHTGEIIKGGAAADGSFMKDIDDTLSSAMTTVLALTESARVNKELSGMMRSVVDMSEQISGYVRGIEEIEDEVELIAFNASVKAGHIGEEGRPLGVIADTMQSLSSETHVHTISIAATLKAVAASVRELSENIASREKAGETETTGMSSSLKGMVESLSVLNSEIIGSLADIEKEGVSLTDEIRLIIDKTSVHKIVEQVTDDVLSRISEMSSALKDTLPELAQSRAGGPRSVLMRKETEEAAGRLSGASGPAGGATEGFGENVEFF